MAGWTPRGGAIDIRFTGSLFLFDQSGGAGSHLGRPPAVDHQLRPRNEGRLVRRQEEGGEGHVQGTLEAYTGELWDQVHDVDVKGVVLGTKCAIAEMRKAEGGSIINISSIAGLSGGAVGSPAAYSAAKAAVHLISKQTTIEYGREGIRANTIFPGPIDTIQMREVVGDRLPMLERGVPIGRIGTPLEIAYGALFLASDESSYIAGAELVIDGGVTSRIGGGSEG